jgi:(p)ppGpp synthase/HD superfamily hydrolase
MLTERFARAIDFTFYLHQQQRRKGSQTPYIAHLLGVTALVLEDGGDEDEAIAALLHDAVEDQGGRETLESIRLRFGERVAEIVASCTDAYEIPKPPWRERKERYLAHLRTATPEARRVSLADKLYNARSILVDLDRGQEDLWRRFRGGKDGTLWYYRELLSIFRQHNDSPMVKELERVMQAIEKLL